MTAYGPKVTKLIIQFMAREAIPPGGGIAAGLEFFKDPEIRQKIMGKAVVGAFMAIELIKIAPDNPYGHDDETIAGILLEQIEKRKQEQGEQ